MTMALGACAMGARMCSSTPQGNLTITLLTRYSTYRTRRQRYASGASKLLLFSVGCKPSCATHRVGVTFLTRPGTCEGIFHGALGVSAN